MTGVDLRNAAHGETRSGARERFERLHRVLRDRICLLEYGPGARLGEVELAREFGISRTPVRRVLGRLEAEGLVERRHGVGTIVTDVDADSLEQVYRLRLELASLMGRLTPLRCDNDGLALFRTHLARCGELVAAPDPSLFAQLNLDFNLKLFGMIGNVPLREITEQLYFQTTRIWILSIPKADDIAQEIRIFGRQIRDVVDALEIGDHAAVGDICRAHISMSFERMRRQLEAAETPLTLEPASAH